MVVLLVGRCYETNRAEWELRAETALAVAEVQRERADSLSAEAEAHRARADSLTALAGDSYRNAIYRLPAISEATPPELALHPAVTLRDTVIVELRIAAEGYREALEEAGEAYEALEAAYGLLEASTDSLRAVLRDRPGGRHWALPHVGLGPFAGICSDGSFCKGLGLTVTWEVGL